MANAINWFSIPADDFQRAVKFYETIFGITLSVSEQPDGVMAMFPVDWQKGEVGGDITKTKDFKPSSDGSLLFLNGGPDLQVVLDRVKSAGGKVVMPKTAIPMQGAGYMAMFLDPEGNRVGLHSMG
jgi:predicted enzyme related to lactoylglutathione lyase